MPDAHDVLERIGDRVAVPQPAFDRLTRRRDRKRRNQRIAAGVVGVAVFAVVVLAFSSLIGLDRGSKPLTPTEPLPANGAVVYAANSPRPGGKFFEWRDLYLARDGTTQRIVGSDGDGVDQYCPSFSPDGSMLAYTEATQPSRPPGDVVIVVTRLSASGDPIGSASRIGATTMADPDLLCAIWSSDGRRLLYVDDAGMWIATLDPAPTTELIRNAESLSFSGRVSGRALSPDFSQFARWVDNGLLFIPTDGGEGRFLPVLPFESPGWGRGSITWSPDGTRIAVGKGGTHPGLQVIDVEDGTARTLGAGQPPIGGEPTWSPDGSAIAFVVDEGIALADPDTGHVLTLPPVVVPEISRRPLGIWDVAWSPDGRRLLTIGYSRDGYALISVAADGTSPAIALSPESWGLYFTMMADVDWQAVPR